MKRSYKIKKNLKPLISQSHTILINDIFKIMNSFALLLILFIIVSNSSIITSQVFYSKLSCNKIMSVFGIWPLLYEFYLATELSSRWQLTYGDQILLVFIFYMLWPLTLMNCGQHQMQIAFLWLLKCCGLWQQQIVNDLQQAASKVSFWNQTMRICLLFN